MTLGIGRHMSGDAEPFNVKIDEFRVSRPPLPRSAREHLEDALSSLDAFS